MKPTPHPTKAPVTLVQDPIDALLKTDAARARESYLDDDGFTLTVMDRLPARRTLSPWVRNGIPMAFGAVAVLFAFVFAGAGNFLVDASMDLATGTATPAALAFGALVGLLAGTAFGMARGK